MKNQSLALVKKLQEFQRRVKATRVTLIIKITNGKVFYERVGCTGTMELVRHVSFVDCQGMIFNGNYVEWCCCYGCCLVTYRVMNLLPTASNIKTSW
jgi:hypothetical protein